VPITAYQESPAILCCSQLACGKASGHPRNDECFKDTRQMAERVTSFTGWGRFYNRMQYNTNRISSAPPTLTADRGRTT